MDTVKCATRSGGIAGFARPRSPSSLALLVAVMIAVLGVGNEAHGLYFFWSAERIDGCTEGDPKPDLYGSFPSPRQGTSRRAVTAAPQHRHPQRGSARPRPMKSESGSLRPMPQIPAPIPWKTSRC